MDSALNTGTSNKDRRAFRGLADLLSADEDVGDADARIMTRVGATRQQMSTVMTFTELHGTQAVESFSFQGNLVGGAPDLAQLVAQLQLHSEL